MKKVLIMIFSICLLVGCNNTEKNDNNMKNTDNDLNNSVIELNENEIQEPSTINSNENNDEIIEDKEEVINVEEENKKEEKIDVVEEVSVDATALSNKTNAWGFVRKKDGVQPEFAAIYTKVLEEYKGIYVGNKEEQVVYLTFDEGYENGYTPAILDTLKEKECPATFFVTTPYVKKNADLVQRMIDEGHIVGNHTVNHPSMPSVTDDEKLKNEVMGLHDYIKENFNYEMTYLRPPKGEYSERTVAISKDLGYKTVLWSQAYDDWDVNNQKGIEYAKKMILNNLHNGAVILLHAVSKDNTEVLGEVIDEIRNRGYEISPLDEFVY